MSAATDPLACPVLAYHSQNVFANHYGQNDHLSLAQDLAALQAIGKRVVPLTWLVDWVLGRRPGRDLWDAVCITFDDGCKLEMFDLEYPGHGLQESFVSILTRFRKQFMSQGQSDLQATTFVIASPRVRNLIDTESLFGDDWMSDEWWQQAQSDGLLDIQSHGWDHKHPTQDHAGQDERPHGRFDTVNTFAECELQVRRSAALIAERARRDSPQLFAYPYGKASPYMRETYLPENAESLGIEAAFSTTPEHVTRQSDRWALPRYVCGRDWKTPERFLEVLNGQYACGASDN